MASVHLARRETIRPNWNDSGVAGHNSGFAPMTQVAEKLQIPMHQLQLASRRLPVAWPKSYLNLVRQHDDPIARMGKPAALATHPDVDEIPDPVRDQSLRPVPYVVQKHPDRIIVLASHRCHFYCRFCFRRDQPPHLRGTPGSQDWNRICDYVRSQPRIAEVILSGGDPLTLADADLFSIGDRLRRIPHVKKWRLHSRAPVTCPERVCPALLRGLAARMPCTLVTHFNHVQEITPDTGRIARTCRQFGIQFSNQAVLLKSVNDSVASQVSLWTELIDRGIHAHYLHHPDRVAGNARFRVSIRHGLEIYSGLLRAMGKQAPLYVLDLPDGTGKVPVASLISRSPGDFVFVGQDGRLSSYRDIDAPHQHKESLWM